MFEFFPAPQHLSCGAGESALILTGNHFYFSVLQMRTCNVKSDLVHSSCHAWFHSAGAGLKCNFRVKIVQCVLQCTECSGHQIIDCQDGAKMKYSASFCRMRMDQCNINIIMQAAWLCLPKPSHVNKQHSGTFPHSLTEKKPLRSDMCSCIHEATLRGRNIQLVCVFVQEMWRSYVCLCCNKCIYFGRFPIQSICCCWASHKAENKFR